MSERKVRLDRACFIPGCKTGYSSDRKVRKLSNETCPSLFKAPTKSAILDWQEVIPRSDKKFGLNNVVCSSHFPEQDIIHFYETTMPDGSINRIKRGRPILRKGSVPCIFPNLSSDLTKEKAHKKRQKKLKTASLEPSKSLNKTQINAKDSNGKNGLYRSETGIITYNSTKKPKKLQNILTPEI